MIKSLILTALLTSGVGANATPLLNKKAETEQTQIVERNNTNIYAYADTSAPTTEGQQTDYGTTWSQTNFWSARKQNIHWTQTPDSPSQPRKMYINRKFELGNIENNADPTNAGSIRANLYTNNSLIQFRANNEYKSGWLYDIYPNNEYSVSRNTTFYAIQYTPYQNITTNYITTRVWTQPGFQIYCSQQAYENIAQAGVNYFQIKFKETYNVLQSTNNWARIMDRTMTENNESNYDLYNELTNSANGYTFNRITKVQEVELTQTESIYDYIPTTNEGIIFERRTPINIEQEIKIPIDPKQINYIVIYKTIELLIQDLNGNDISQYLNQDNGHESAFMGIQDAYGWYEENQTSTYSNPNDEGVYTYWRLEGTGKIQFSGTYAPPVSMEVIDIPSIMFNILSMPFTFVSTAFNLTLFPGTPYQINIGSIILMLFGLLVFIFLFKIILKVFK